MDVASIPMYIMLAEAECGQGEIAGSLECEGWGFVKGCMYVYGDELCNRLRKFVCFVGLEVRPPPRGILHAYRYWKGL